MYLRGGGTQMTIRVRASTSTMSSPIKSSPHLCSISEQISFPMSNPLDPKPAFLPVPNKFAGEENPGAICIINRLIISSSQVSPFCLFATSRSQDSSHIWKVLSCCIFLQGSGRPPKLGLLARDILARATGLETVP